MPGYNIHQIRSRKQILNLLPCLLFGYTTGEMIPFQERKKLRKILYAKATLGVLFVLSVIVARGAWHVYQKAAIARAERTEAERSFEELAGRAKELEESITRLKSERGIEEEIRQKFTVARSGEEVVIVVDETSKKSKNGASGESISSWMKFLEFWK